MDHFHTYVLYLVLIGTFSVTNGIIFTVTSEEERWNYTLLLKEKRNPADRCETPLPLMTQLY